MQEARLRYVFGNGLAELAARWADDLAAAPLDDPLRSEIVVVPHPGMGRWLQQFLAQRFGIAAFFDFLLPGEYAWRLLRALEPKLPEQNAYDPDALAWRIHGLLPELSETRGFETVARYLEDGDPLKTWELAQRLATAFDQYLLYRPRWLEHWSRGKTTGISNPHEAWQAPLWRAVREAIGVPHRVELMRGAIERAGREPLDLSDAALRASVFGVSTLPPIHLETIVAMSAHLPTSWYHLNPSAEYWGDIVLRKERPAMIARLAKQGVAEPDRHLDEGHRLLASWGALGRDFMRLLYELPVTLDDELVPRREDPASIVGWVRTGLSRLKLDFARPPPITSDHSLRLHACASRQREVEVLHDALLGLLEADRTLTPRDIVVMSPRPADYAPLVAAVFGSMPPERHIPFTIADQPNASRHAIVEAFRLLLDLPGSRLPASTLLTLLAVPAIARRYDLGADDVARIARWIEALRVRWGLDAADRAASGAAAFDEFAWRPALDRLLLGYATGTHDELVAGALPYDDIEGQGAAAAGALARLVETLAAWRHRFARVRPARGWQKVWSNALFELIDTDHATPDERDATLAVTGALKAWVEAVKRGGEADAPLDVHVARAAVLERLDSPERHARLLATGVTVCAMVPLRNVPFRVVCLLGLDDGEFPRREPATSFNLMRGAHLPGDRSRADDDRYLFLEALLAAGDHLHLSWLAINARDGSPRPPAMPVQELLDAVVAAYAPDERDAVRAKLLVVPPAAAFDPGNFAPGAAARSPEWLAAARVAAGEPRESRPFAQAHPEEGGETTIALADLFAFYRHAPRDYARRVLELDLPEVAADEDDEPFDLSGLERFALDDAVLARLLARPGEDDAAVVAWLRAQNLLRAGALGELDAREHALEVRPLAENFRARLAESEMSSVEDEWRVGPYRVTGRIDRVTADGPLSLKAGKARASDWIALGVSALLLGVPRAHMLSLDREAGNDRVLDATKLGQPWLLEVLRAYVEGRTSAVPLLRYASWAWAEAFEPKSDPVAAEKKARAKIVPGRGDKAFVELDDPYVALLLRGQDDPVSARFIGIANSLLVPLVGAIT